MTPTDNRQSDSSDLTRIATFLESNPVAISITAFISFIASQVAGWSFWGNHKDEILLVFASAIMSALSAMFVAAYQSRRSLYSLLRHVDDSTPKRVNESQMYEGMLSCLEKDSITDIRVTSFQSHNPLTQSYCPSMRYYHTKLEEYMKRHKSTRLRRIVAVHTIEKLQWLKSLVDQYGKQARAKSGGVSIRILDCPNDFGHRGSVALPAIVQIFKNKVFLADPHSLITTHAKDVSCVMLEDETFAGFWSTYYERLWDACEKDEVIDCSMKNQDNLERIVFSRIESFIKYVVSPACAEHPSSPSDVWKLIEPAARVFPEWYRGGRPEPDGRPYGRRVLIHGPEFEVMIAYWNECNACLPHDHGDSEGVMVVLSGKAEIQDYTEASAQHSREHGVVQLSLAGKPRTLPAADTANDESSRYPCCIVKRKVIHATRPVESGLVTLHIYKKPIPWMRVFDLTEGRGITVSAGCGAWWPTDDGELHAGATEFKASLL